MTSVPVNPKHEFTTTITTHDHLRPTTSTSILLHLPQISRRTTLTATFLTSLLHTLPATAAFEFGFVAPDQTLDEAEVAVKIHARELVGVKSFIEQKSWSELQIVLRESGSGLKQDVYTIIQSLPGNKRPEMRKLYSKLFNNVTRMDYAARSKDASLVQEHYQNVVAILNEIFARIQA